MALRTYVNLIRALGCEFLLQFLKPLSVLAAAVMLVVLAIILWLTTVNVWWWLLAAVVLIGIMGLVGLVVVLAFAFRLLRPEMTMEQRTAVHNFANKLQQAADDIRTPWPWIAGKVLLDIIHPRPQGYITRLSTSSRTLYPDFRQLQDLFSAKPNL